MLCKNAHQDLTMKAVATVFPGLRKRNDGFSIGTPKDRSWAVYILLCSAQPRKKKRGKVRCGIRGMPGFVDFARYCQEYRQDQKERKDAQRS